jgi:hypothetical protein
LLKPSVILILFSQVPYRTLSPSKVLAVTDILVEAAHIGGQSIAVKASDVGARLLYFLSPCALVSSAAGLRSLGPKFIPPNPYNRESRGAPRSAALLHATSSLGLQVVRLSVSLEDAMKSILATLLAFEDLVCRTPLSPITLEVHTPRQDLQSWRVLTVFTHSSSRCGLLLALLVLMLVFTPVPGMAQNFTIIALPDTQGYTDSYPATFTAQTEWIANNISALNIKAVVGLGDIAEGARGPYPMGECR